MTAFPTDNDEMVVVGPIEFASLCGHHLAPFMGKAWVGYIPSGQALGLSKIPRLVRWASGSPCKQEDLTTFIVSELQEALKGAKGIAVVMRALHLCMAIRGIRTHECWATTSKMVGAFLDPTKQARQEFFNLVNRDYHVGRWFYGYPKWDEFSTETSG